MSAPRIPRPGVFSAAQLGLMMLAALALWGAIALVVMGAIVLWRLMQGWVS